MNRRGRGERREEEGKRGRNRFANFFAFRSAVSASLGQKIKESETKWNRVESSGPACPGSTPLEKVTGTTVYGPDLKLPETLHGKVLRSPLPHARILHVDTSRAERLPGVKAVATGKDLSVRYGLVIQDQSPFAWTRSGTSETPSPVWRR